MNTFDSTMITKPITAHRSDEGSFGCILFLSQPRLAQACPGWAGDSNWAGRRVTPAACQQSEVSSAVERTWVTRSHLLPVINTVTVTTGSSQLRQDKWVTQWSFVCHHPQNLLKQSKSEDQWSERNISCVQNGSLVITFFRPQILYSDISKKPGEYSQTLFWGFYKSDYRLKSRNVEYLARASVQWKG